MEERLIKFVKVVDAKSFTKAATELHISQPALTAAIQKLERELHSTLLVRSRHTLELTAAGKLAYAAGTRLLTSSKNLQTQLDELKNSKLHVSIGMIDSIAEALFVHQHELTELEAWAHVSLTINNSGLLIQDVLQRKLDIVVTTEPLETPKVLVRRELGAEPLIFVTRADRLFEAKEQLHDGVITNFLSYNQNSMTHHLLVQTAQQRGIALEPSFYSTSPEIILELVLAGRGTAALPYLKVKQYLDAGTLVPVALSKRCVVERHIVALHYAQQDIPANLVAMLDRCQALLADILREAKRWER